MKRKSLELFLLLAFAGTPLLADFEFKLQPQDGAISGPPESTIGWGYTITNDDPALWLVPADLNADGFIMATGVPLFLFPAVAPGTTLSVGFQPDIDGLYEITWDPGAPAGWAEYGAFHVNFDWWTDDPLAGGAFDHYAGLRDLSYSAEVSQVPEPGAALLLLGEIVLVFKSRRSFRRRNQTRGIQ